jgi:propanol-preferring alcohol dehydrogenase
MKAAILEAVGQPLVLGDVPRPELGPDEVLVQTRACGICGTDLHMHAGWGYQPQLPFVMGHEPSGVVAEVGSHVTRFQPGDRVVPNIFYACGQCFYCRTNRETQCTQLGGILGVLGHWGGYGEYFKIPARQLFPLPDTVSFAEGAVIADAVVTAVHAVQRGRVAPGEAVAVIGVGGCGSAALQIAQLYGAQAIGVDQSERKRAHALALGAAAAVNGAEVDPIAAVRDWAGGAGAQCVIDTVGSTASVAQGLAMLARGGRLVILGYTQERPAVDPRQLAVNELEILGTRSGGRQNTAEAIALVADPRWRPIVSDTFPITEVNAALEHLRSGAALGRIVLTFDAA